MLDEGDKAIVREIAFEAVHVISSSIMAAIDTQIRLHALSCEGTRVEEKIDNHASNCEAKKTIQLWPKQFRAMLIGLVLGSAVVSSGVTLGVLEVVKVIFAK